jgi:hypothetical protein
MNFCRDFFHKLEPRIATNEHEWLRGLWRALSL